jgi:pyruvate,water dikinase
LHQYRYIKWLHEVTKNDLPLVGGKGANLGELIQAQIQVPPGFCVTAAAYQEFLKAANLETDIASLLQNLDVEDSRQLQAKSAAIRRLIMQAPVPEDIAVEVKKAYAELSQRVNRENLPVAVRSSATAEDLPEASFAGQQDTYLYICGSHSVVEHVRQCWASLWTDRAVYYREKQGFNHLDVSLSVVIQKDG